MRHLLAVILATLAAVLAPAVCFAAWILAQGGAGTMSFVPLILFAACFVALPHAVLLGLPIAGWLLRLGKFRLLPMTVAGAAVGAIPAVIWRTSSWDAAQVTIADHAAFGAFAAGLGAIGSAAFLFTYLGVRPNHSFKPTPLRGAA